MQICYSHPLAVNIGLQGFLNGYEKAENTTKYEEEVMIITLVVLVTHRICTEVALWHDEI